MKMKNENEKCFLKMKKVFCVDENFCCDEKFCCRVVVSCRVVSCRVVSCRVVSWRVVILGCRKCRDSGVSCFGGSGGCRILAAWLGVAFPGVPKTPKNQRPE